MKSSNFQIFKLSNWFRTKPAAAPMPEPAPATMVKIDDPAWPGKARALTDRLANTPEQDPLMVGLLGFIECEIVIQVGRCERAGLTDAEAHGLTSRIGVLVALKRDLEAKWREARARLQRD